jgi:hypothetical protein
VKELTPKQIANREYYLLNKHKWNEVYNERNFNKEKSLEAGRRCYEKNRERYKGRMRAMSRKRRDTNKEEVNRKQREYYHKNREIIRKQRCEYDRERRQIPEVKLVALLRLRLYEALKRNVVRKTNNAITLLGCTVEEARKHIESLWQPGMSWENYTNEGWHVDHIIPCRSFDLTDPAQQKKCFHYTNLQPLWAKENHSKNDSLPNGVSARTIN